ncbi:uncharacterized protein [Parasteatoda tepidariorum]|uniref:uncharacterized protein n=1 Tax=Parasteatoda tepidariorum TaxID=114398 RepID=UPI001C71E23D|nr:uncharacterized protein LOC107443176 [Parasteatoda tepidariorum]
MKLLRFLSTFLFCLGITQSSPTPPTPPVPQETFWKVSDGLETCIKANLKIRFEIPSNNGSRYLVLSPTADSNKSSCDGLNVLWLHSDNEFDFIITFERQSGRTYAKNVTLQLLSTNETGFFFNDLRLFSYSNYEYGYYMCKSLVSVSLGKATMEIFDMAIQAYGITDEYSIWAGDRCLPDKWSYTGAVIIGIGLFAVGFAIGKLVTKSCINFFNRQKSYDPL